MVSFISEYFNTQINNKAFKIYRSEIKFKDILNKAFSGVCDFIPQYYIDGYRIDFYEANYNLAIEYDEKHHEYQETQDKKREREIRTKLNCKFIRVEKNKEIEGINSIFKYIVKKLIDNDVIVTKPVEEIISELENIG